MQEITNKKRLSYLDAAKGIGILLVVAGHVIGEGNKPFRYSNIIRDYMYSFHMALFFVVAGILMRYSAENHYHKFYIKNKFYSIFQKLLVPYFLWSIVYFVLDNRVLANNLYEWILCTLTFYGRAPIWFLAALFFAEIFMLFVIYLDHSRFSGRYQTIKMIVLMIMLVLSVVSWNCYSQIENLMVTSMFAKYSTIFVFREFVCVFFVLVGYVGFSMIINNESRKIVWIKLCISSIVSITIFCVFKNGSNLHTFSIVNIYVFLISGIAGSCMVIFFCKLICSVKNIKSLEWLGQHSLGIMCIHYTHLPFMEYATDICNYIGLTGKMAFLFSLSLVLGGSILCIKLIKKISSAI